MPSSNGRRRTIQFVPVLGAGPNGLDYRNSDTFVRMGLLVHDTVGQYFSIISFVILHGSITFLALTIIWLVFGRRRLVVRVLASVLVFFMETTEFTYDVGTAHVGRIVAYFAIFTFWLIVSLLVIRLAGYRLQWRWPRTAS